MRTIVVTSTSPYRRPMFELTYTNMIEYCNIHGYDYDVIEMEDGNWAYKKHERFKELFERGYELIWYRDDDGIITNLTLPIEAFVNSKSGFYITKDAGGLNGGSIIIKNSKKGIELNNLILDNRHSFNNEQELLNSFYGSSYWKDLLKVLPHPSINSYKNELYSEFPERVGREDLGEWKPEHLFLHLPALTIEKRIEIIKNIPILK